MTVHGVRTLAEALAVVETVPGTMPGWSTVTAPANR